MTANHSATGGIRQRETKTVVENRQARHLYFVEDTLEAGLKLEGWEVKAILSGRATFNSGAAFIRLRDGEAFLESLTITPAAQDQKGMLEELLPQRPRKLLLNKAELRKLERRVAEKGYTVVPLEVTYGRVLKLNIGLARGKKLADKRDTVKARDQSRELARDLKALA
ncbi:SsrA-binding protein [compost metagenome]